MQVSNAEVTTSINPVAGNFVVIHSISLGGKTTLLNGGNFETRAEALAAVKGAERLIRAVRFAGGNV